jgi:hypothetical protein
MRAAVRTTGEGVGCGGVEEEVEGWVVRRVVAMLGRWRSWGAVVWDTRTAVWVIADPGACGGIARPCRVVV